MCPINAKTKMFLLPGHIFFAENEDATVTAKLNIAGTEKGDVRVSVCDDYVEVYLTIKGEEIQFTEWQIPRGVKSSQVKALYSNGILKVTFPMEGERKDIEVA